MKCLLIRMTQREHPVRTTLIHYVNSVPTRPENNRDKRRRKRDFTRIVGIDTARCTPAASRKLRSAGMAGRAGKLRELRIDVKEWIAIGVQFLELFATALRED